MLKGKKFDAFALILLDGRLSIKEICITYYY